MSSFVTIASRAARAAGEIIVHGARDLHRVQSRSKGDRDLVSEVDLRAEARIVEILGEAFPEHGIRGEEGTARAPGGSQAEWLVDPLDGTRNFLHGYPFYCVSIALLDQGRIECGVVYDPLRGELFEATRGRGAKLNDHRIRVGESNTLAEALISTGSPPVSVKTARAMGNALLGLHCSAAGVRQSGSSALDLAHLAAGRVNGFVHFGLQPWDSAAGALLVQEAGGLVTDFHGGPGFLESGELVAASPRISRLLLASLGENLPAA
ncbi:MAG: inositol monophosphatase [Gammaproteobacteria bacterium]|nr:inositol monophosphatase [Gammaproteobacteria bacterium]